MSGNTPSTNNRLSPVSVFHTRIVLSAEADTSTLVADGCQRMWVTYTEKQNSNKNREENQSNKLLRLQREGKQINKLLRLQREEN